MKLYEVPRNTKVRLLNNQPGPPGGIGGLQGGEYFFSHVDGMFSVCKDPQGNVVYLPAWSGVEIVNE